MHIQLDALGGIAGDMFIAAALDAWPEHADGVLEAIRTSGVPADWAIDIIDHRDEVLCGKRFAVLGPGNCTDSHGGDADGRHMHGQHAHHVSFRDIARGLREGQLDPAVCRRALAIFGLLAEAEAEVHGVAAEDVSFHELGAWDSVADIVGAAYLIQVLNPSSWSAGPVPIGGGRIATAHGPMPSPAPATAKLLQGFTLVDDGIAGERVTPTGAAILCYLRSALGVPGGSTPRPVTLARGGTGFGMRTLAGISNVLRILCFDEAPARRIDDHVAVINFEVDDQTAEDLAVGIDALRAGDGVIDVLQVPAVGKKGRLVSQIQLLCRQDALSGVIDACFLETTTLGLRWTIAARATLDRRFATVDADGRGVGVKIATRPDGRSSAKAEVEHCRGPGGHVTHRQRRTRAEEQALQDLALDEE